MLSIFRSFLIISFFFTVTYILNYYYLKKKDKSISVPKKKLKYNFMGSILISFGLLKMYDLNKFVDIFKKYDIITQKITNYGYMYPFIEMGLGVAYLARYNIYITNMLTAMFMVISIISVLITMYNGKKLRCGCMGSFLHIPLSYVTLSENLFMLYMIFGKNNILAYINGER